MKVLITGATGFIGSHVANAFLAAGHHVTGTVRNPHLAAARLPGLDAREVDYRRALAPAAWTPLVAGMDVVINAVGILRESAHQTFDVLHHRAPGALFNACAQSGVKRVIQISALGADTGDTAYFRSKHAADEILSGLGGDYVIVQPSIVFGPGGGSARLFSRTVRLPIIPLPGAGDQRIQPVFIDDLVDVVAALARLPELPARRIPLVGPVPLSLKAFYARLHAALNVPGKARFMHVPMPFVRIGAYAGRYLPGVPLDPDTLQMLMRGNTADSAATRLLLGHEPRPVERFHMDENRRASQSR